jgi:hypothetical protein
MILQRARACLVGSLKARSFLFLVGESANQFLCPNAGWTSCAHGEKLCAGKPFKPTSTLVFVLYWAKQYV